jgi:hypothetical protein
VAQLAISATARRNLLNFRILDSSLVLAATFRSPQETAILRDFQRSHWRLDPSSQSAGLWLARTSQKGAVLPERFFLALQPLVPLSLLLKV